MARLKKYIASCLLAMVMSATLSGCKAGGQSEIEIDNITIDNASYEYSLEAAAAVNQLINDRIRQADITVISDDLRNIKKCNQIEGEAWDEIEKYWGKVNENGFVNTGIVPDDWPKDNSLCVVVLGYQLNADGSMKDELVGRCQTALEIAYKYPESNILVTGGGTASGNRDATEADMMADWFMSNGIDDERIIIENKSMTTTENALFSYRLLKEGYEQTASVVLVTSDYHIPLGCLLFQAQFLMGYYYDDCPRIEVIDNLGLVCDDKLPFDINGQGRCLQSLYGQQ